MTVGEKIKTFRNIRGFSQKTLGELSGMNEVTIRKYEAGDRNPKPEQLLKIANALGISINIFMDFDVNTVSDVLSLIFKSFLVKYEWDIKSYPFNIVLVDNIVTGLRLEVSFFLSYEKSAA